MINKKLLSVAILGALASGSAFAANLSAPGGAPAYFAQEIIATEAAPVQLTTSASSATELNWDVGYNFSDVEVRHARLECTTNLRFDSGSNVSMAPAGAANIGGVNGLGTNVMTFSITSTDATNPIEADHVLTVSGDHSITGTDQNVNCTAALYDTPSQALNGGPDGRISTSVSTGAYLAFAPSYELVTSPLTQTAEVESDPAFSEFVPGTSVFSPLWAGLSGVTYGLRDPDGAGPQNAPFRIDGNEITLADLFHADTSLTFRGDLSAFNTVGLNPYPTVAPNADGTSATITVGSTASAATPWGVVKPAATVMQESEYFVTLNAVAVAPTVYDVTDITNVPAGEIVRNGTVLQAPLVQLPGGGRWQSRIVLTNTGNAERDYTIAVQSEDGVTVNPGPGLTGTIGAQQTLVLNVSDLVSFPGRARATLIATVAAPNNQIQGLYQIVDVDNGGISNETMVRPGTN